MALNYILYRPLLTICCQHWEQDKSVTKEEDCPTELSGTRHNRKLVLLHIFIYIRKMV